LSRALSKLTVHFGERDRVGDELLADALVADFARHGVHTSVLLRGIEGFGLRHHLRTDRLLTLSEDLPAAAIAIDEPARIDGVVEELPGPTGTGLVTREEVGAVDAGADQKLTVYLNRRQRLNGAPAYVVACELLRRHRVGGATALLGVDGTVGGSRRRARFFSANSDVPMMVVAVGAADSIAAARAELERVLEVSLLTTEPVRVLKRDGERVGVGSAEEAYADTWQRLTLYSSESATTGGHAVHHELIHRLRRGGARGATAVRGIWGYHGDHEPHGDRLLQLRRRAPIVTTVVDQSNRIGSWFALVDGLTPERGLVTCEPVWVLRSQSSTS
jgi:PII-like signaling protein